MKTKYKLFGNKKRIIEFECPICKTIVIKEDGLWYCKTCKKFFQETYIKKLNQRLNKK